MSAPERRTHLTGTQLLPFVIGAVLIPLGFGLVPAFIPRRVPVLFRWCLWLMLLAASIVFVSTMRGAPTHFALLALSMLCLSTGLSFWVLFVETRRGGREDSNPAWR